MGARWVAVLDGTSNQVYTAFDPSNTWTVATSSGLGTSGGVTVAHERGTWVAGANNGKVVTATESTGTWGTAASGVTSWVWGIAYGNGYWVLGTDDVTNGPIRYATDPSGSWSKPSSPGTTAGYGVGYLGGYWVMNRAGGYSYATGPTDTWTVKTVASYTGAGQVAYDGTNWAFIGDTKLLYTSDLTVAASTATPGLSGTTWRGLYYANGYWVAGGQAPNVLRVATSLSGTWSTPSSVGFGTGSYVFWITYRGGVWVAGGYDGARAVVRTATDPLGTWSVAASYPNPTGVSFRGIVAAGGQEKKVATQKQAVTRAAVF